MLKRLGIAATLATLHQLTLVYAGTYIDALSMTSPNLPR